jgi:hypothetical protein
MANGPKKGLGKLVPGALLGKLVSRRCRWTRRSRWCRFDSGYQGELLGDEPSPGEPRYGRPVRTTDRISRKFGGTDFQRDLGPMSRL